MADRFFPNKMHPFISETSSHSNPSFTDSLTNLLHLPYKTLIQILNKSASNLKDTAGVCALGAVVAMHNGDEQLCHQYLTQFKQIKLPKNIPNELLYGRAGYLWACSFLNKNLGKDTVSPTRMRAVVDEIINSGRQLAKGRCRLMYEWHGNKYWGAAHGLAGIMHVLMDMDLKPDELEHVKGTLRYMIKNRYPSSERSATDNLVHWCHGAPGVALTLAKAAKVENVFFSENLYTKDYITEN